jgi:hypothetical protein
MIIRRVIAALLVLLALTACVLAMANRAGINHTVKNSQLLDKQFEVATTAIEAFRMKNGRRPYSKEWDAVLARSKGYPYDVMVATSGFSACDRDAASYERLAGKDYILIAWRGEWYECYAPTKSMSTLIFDASQYAILGTIWLDTVMFAGIAAFSVLGAIKLSRSNKIAH